MLLIVGIGMALRASELVGLQVGDVYERKKIKSYVEIRGETAKFKKSRTIRIGDDIQDAIADFIDWKGERKESIAKTAPLFVSQKGGYLTRVALFQIVRKIFDAAGIDQSPHALRKTGATIYYIESEYDLIATQRISSGRNLWTPGVRHYFIAAWWHEYLLWRTRTNRPESSFGLITTPNFDFISDNHLRFYTGLGSGFTRHWHPKSGDSASQNASR